jgi:voltage-gated potassium channel
MDSHQRSLILDKIERATEIPSLLLSIVFIPILIVPWILDLNPEFHTTLNILDKLIWAIFAFDLMIKTYFSPNRIQYLRSHPFDVLIVALPFLRPLRIVRAAKTLKLIRFIRIFVTLGYIGGTFKRIAKREGIQLSLAFALIIFVVTSLLLYSAEKNSGSEINSLGSALWWAIATLTNVGAGNITPETALGKGIGVFLMICGVGIFTSLAANIAAVILEDPQEDKNGIEIKEELADIKRTLEKIDLNR